MFRGFRKQGALRLLEVVLLDAVGHHLLAVVVQKGRGLAGSLLLDLLQLLLLLWRASSLQLAGQLLLQLQLLDDFVELVAVPVLQARDADRYLVVVIVGGFVLFGRVLLVVGLGFDCVVVDEL